MAKKLSHLKKVMKSYLGKGCAADIEREIDNNSCTAAEKAFYHYGYGKALKDVLENFFLEEKVNIEDYKEELENLIGKIKAKYPTCITGIEHVTNYVPDYMAELELGVYMIPSDSLVGFADFTDGLHLKWWEKTKVSLIIMGHTEKDTKQYYPEVLKKLW